MKRRPLKAIVTLFTAGAFIAGSAGTADAASVDFGRTEGKCADRKATLVSRTVLTLPDDAARQAGVKIGQLRIYQRTVDNKTTYCAAVAVRKDKTVRRTNVAIVSLKEGGGTMDSRSSKRQNRGAGMAQVKRYDGRVKVVARVVGVTDSVEVSKIAEPIARPIAAPKEVTSSVSTDIGSDGFIAVPPRPGDLVPVEPGVGVWREVVSPEGEHSGSRIAEY
jgi:hypothetical protein